jgi:hypothetical protein
VAAFVVEYVGSLEELEILILLVMSDERWWDAGSSSRELGLPIARARAALDALASRNLLDIRITEDVRYKFRPGTPELEISVTALTEAYRRDPAAVVQLVARAGPRSVRDFADAFRIRRRDGR